MSKPEYVSTVHVEVLKTIVTMLSLNVSPRTGHHFDKSLFVYLLHKLSVAFFLKIIEYLFLSLNSQDRNVYFEKDIIFTLNFL